MYNLLFFKKKKKLSFINGGYNDVEDDNNVYCLGESNESNCSYKFIYLVI